MQDGTKHKTISCSNSIPSLKQRDEFGIQKVLPSLHSLWFTFLLADLKYSVLDSLASIH